MYEREKESYTKIEKENDIHEKSNTKIKKEKVYKFIESKICVCVYERERERESNPEIE